MLDPQGVLITNADVYNLLQTIDRRVIKIENTLENQEKDQRDIREDSARIRVLQAQVAAMWVVHTIMIAAITANYIKGIS
jgi:hypothetical protein